MLIRKNTQVGTALPSFAAGSLLTARLMHLNQVRADSNRVFQLMVYHTLPGKCPPSSRSFVTFQSYKPSTISFDSGDHLHPNDVGYEAMGNSIDIGLFR
jgi:hypothetical protein